MAIPSFNSRLLIGYAQFDVYATSATPTWTMTPLAVTALSSQPKSYIAGPVTATFGGDMMIDTTASAGSELALLEAWRQASQPISWCPSGTAVGSEAWVLEAIQSQWTGSSPVNDVTAGSFTAQVTGPPDIGVVLAGTTAVTADGSTTSVDNAASSANGGAAHLHVTAYSGLTSDAIIVEHSTNNSVWATLGTFTTVTALTSQRLTIAAGTTVNRYLRVTHDVTGTGSITAQVTFARR